MRRGVVALGLLALAGCGSSTYGGGSSAGSSSSGGSSSSSAPAASDAVLKTASSSLGTIAVDAHGRTVYVFDKDTGGKSSCTTGPCAALWPAVTADSATPKVDGVTGNVGTITWDDGTVQVTLAGRPLYTYAGDSNAGDVSGQGVQGTWWVVSADGTAVKAASSPAPSGY
jgi:predicted lipoprotein with Yx(FWY)xxD motif